MNVLSWALARDSHLGPQHSKGNLCGEGMALHSQASLALRHSPLEHVLEISEKVPVVLTQWYSQSGLHEQRI